MSNTLEEIEFSPVRYKNYLTDTLKNKRKMDSLVTAINKLIVKTYKKVMVSGIPKIKESLLSVYNDEGIMNAALLNNRMQYIYELAIPLKYLTAHLSPDGKLKYNIQVNNNPIRKNPGTVPPPMIRPEFADIETLYANNPTDFNGEYTLAK